MYIFDALSLTLIIESSVAMSAQLPRPSASAGAAMSGRAASRGKLAEARQRQRERAMLLARVDKSREPAVDKTRASNRAAPATPSSVERAHRLLQGSAIKQVNVPLRARTMSPVFELPATIPKIPPTVKRIAITELPPTVKRIAGGEHVGGVHQNSLHQHLRWVGSRTILLRKRRMGRGRPSVKLIQRERTWIGRLELKEG